MKPSWRRLALPRSQILPKISTRSHRHPLPALPCPQQTRSLFSLFSPRRPPRTPPPPPPPPLYGPNDLFHPLATSPVASLRSKAHLIESLAPCPVCLDTASVRRKVKHTCPDCGFPTHCTEEHWVEGKEQHAEYCGRLREVNEDEHDLRSGRVIKEYEMPGPQDYESTTSFLSWDTLFYTRNFPSIDSARAKRHVSKLLTYPMSVAAALHQYGPFSVGSGGGKGKEGNRWTREGKRSIAALHTSLHAPTGSHPSATTRNAKIPIRIFILGARAESSLPPHIWEQITFLFPFTQFRIYFIGPQAALPAVKDGLGAKPVESKEKTEEDVRKIYSPATPNQSSETDGRGRTDTVDYGVPSYTISPSPVLQLTTLQAKYEDVHAQFGPFDPYTDVFFTFCPGLGFPSPSVPSSASRSSDPATAIMAEPVLQAEREWKVMLTQVLETKCPLFITAFSPTDLERDVNSLDKVEGVKGEYDILLEPGENGFGSLKWETAEFDPRVMVRVNWGIWGIRGKRYDVTGGEAED